MWLGTHCLVVRPVRVGGATDNPVVRPYHVGGVTDVPCDLQRGLSYA
jgi:hypothetical protein